MRRRFLSVLAAVAALTLILAACGGGDDDGDTAAGGADKPAKVGVILPDTKSSARWENNDKPLLEAAGVKPDYHVFGTDNAEIDLE